MTNTVTGHSRLRRGQPQTWRGVPDTCASTEFPIGYFDCDLWDAEQRPRCASGRIWQQLEPSQQELAAQHYVPPKRAAHGLSGRSWT
ncbi:hypothetical protein [Streptomyces sp. NPDC058755]|uniref:hypothetical protein n=1 Tax=unclassified Streptomyces TaxID=2593676 RepID=UPI0036A9E647